jgi:hypothetical protein
MLSVHFRTFRLYNILCVYIYIYTYNWHSTPMVLFFVLPMIHPPGCVHVATASTLDEAQSSCKVSRCLDHLASKGRSKTW